MADIRYPVSVYDATVTQVSLVPSAGTDGIPYPGKGNNTECFLLVTGNGLTAGDSIIIRPWWYDPLSNGGAGAWLRGATTTVTDDGAIEAYLIGTRIYWQVTTITIAVAGSFELSNQFFCKGN